MDYTQQSTRMFLSAIRTEAQNIVYACYLTLNDKN